MMGSGKETMPVLHTYDMGSGVMALSTTRQGGVGTGRYGQMNINSFCGDEPQAVAANRLLLAHELGIPETCIVMPHQTHGTVCVAVDNRLTGLTEEAHKASLEGVDGLMTRTPGLCIGVSTADCIPVLLYDAEHRAVAAVHAGWRGTVARITRKAVEAMTRHYATRPEMLKAVIGPGISLESFEVGQEVYDCFSNAGFNMDSMARRFDKWHIDLPACNAMQLQEAGVEPENIHLSGICTYKQPDRFFSARRLGVQSGRIFNGILLKGEK